MPVFTILLHVFPFIIAISIVLLCYSFEFSIAQESRENLIVVPEPGNYNITEGSDRSDIIVGNSVVNVILGEESDDVVMSNQGNDELHGNTGNDILQGV